MPSYVAPPGWPREIRAPGSPEWEESAGRWLLDISPPEYRSYPVLRRHLVVLARFAVLHVEASQSAVARGLGEARTALRDVAGPEVVERVVTTFEKEAARLVGLRRAAGLVEDAVRGRRFVARL